MARGQTQFVGAAGQYYLAHALSLRQINASVTVGNAPTVDVVASSSDGRRSLAFQVKTARNAYCHNRWGHEGCQWRAPIIGTPSESFWYAFVCLHERQREAQTVWNPRIFFVPSLWVAEFVEPDWPQHWYFLPTTLRRLTEDRWDLVEGYLSGNAEAITWAKDWPEGVQVAPRPRNGRGRRGMAEAIAWFKKLAEHYPNL